VTQESREWHLATAGQSDSELIIRASGGRRSSGFLLWQAALAEYWFTDRLYPDFARAGH